MLEYFDFSDNKATIRCMYIKISIELDYNRDRTIISRRLFCMHILISLYLYALQRNRHSA